MDEDGERPAAPARRPVRARGTGWAKRLARALAGAGVSPNAISMAGTGAAALGGLALALSLPADGGARVALLVLGAVCCGVRLACNLLDGMVAVEHGRGSATGPFWNEFPDRVSDALILAGAGFGAGAPALGFAAALLAVLTAYVRTLGAALGTDEDFSGPMAKQARMWVVAAGSLVACFEPLWGWKGESLAAALIVVAAGAGLTALLRARRLLAALKGG